jgi:hypothetical protein
VIRKKEVSVEKPPLSWKKIHSLFNSLRKRYYLHADPPLRIPPKAEEFQWLWSQRNTGAWAITSFDEDHDVISVELHPEMRRSPNTLRLVLLHELSHMRNPVAECGRRSKWWKEESARVAGEGAVTL